MAPGPGAQEAGIDVASGAPAGRRLTRGAGCVGLALAALLAGCSSSSSTPETTESPDTVSSAPAATFTGAYSGTLTPGVCRDTTVDLVVHSGTGVGAGFIENAFPSQTAGTRYRISLYNLGKTGTVFAQAPNDPKYVLSSTDRNVFFLEGIVLRSNGSPRQKITLHGSVNCS